MKKRHNLAIKIGNSPILARAVEEVLLRSGNGWLSGGAVKWNELDDYADHEDFMLFLRGSIITQGRHKEHGDTVIDAATEMGRLIDVISGPKSVEVKLNSEYTAVVSPDRKTVKVGCQTFTREKVEELYFAMTEGD